MSDAISLANNNAESPDGSKGQGASKDRNCPYCNQAFTSSSLGRHLDLYIKEKNPKAPDGIHDVDAIRKMRGNITRRQPRGSLRRDVSAPSTPASAKKSPVPASSAIPKEGQFVVDHQTTPKYPFQTTWEVTGVINDIPARNGEPKLDENSLSQDASRRPSMQQQQQQQQQQTRAPSRAAQKVQLDVRQKLSDTMDTARAAELALRELLSSWRAAKQHVDMNSMPFDFEPLSLDFPALTLQCLQAPPTLFSSTPSATSSSWSIEPPAQKQHAALKAYFQEEFRKWRITCAAATTATAEDLTYPPSNTSHMALDSRDGVKRAERAASLLEKQIGEHLESTYQVWDQLPPQRKSELWGLELARSVGRRQKEVIELKTSQHAMKQENSNLKSQIEQLNRLQQPREYRIVPPATIPIEESLLAYMLDMGAQGQRGIGLSMEDRHVDLNTVVSRAIDRWKTVIVSSRQSGMVSQRSLDQPTPTPTPTSATPVPVLRAPPNPALQKERSVRAANSNRNVQPTGNVATAMTDENSDQDAEAEMEEDESFSAAPITPMVPKPAMMQRNQQLEVPRTRGPVQRVQQNNEGRFVVNGHGGNHGLNIRQSIPNMGMAASHVMLSNGNYGTEVQGVNSGGDQMYID